jgi:hypothetical protein
MTRKDYEIIARAVSVVKSTYDEVDGAYTEIALEVIDELANQLSLELQIDNPRFDRERFREACGLE